MPPHDGEDGRGNGDGSGAREEVPKPAVIDGAQFGSVDGARAAEAAVPDPAWSMGALLPPTLRTAMRALRRNKMRSGLTALGIIIGIAAVITMMEIGQGAKKALAESIASMGANNLVVLAGAASSGGVSFGSGSVLTLTPQDCDEIGRQCAATVSAVAPIVRGRGQVIYGNKNWVPVTIAGTTADYLAVRDWEEMDEGDAFSDRDVRNQAKVCLIGRTLVRELFQDQSPIGKELRCRTCRSAWSACSARRGPT